MTYLEVDWDWTQEQLTKAGAKGTAVGKIVENLLDVLEVAEIKHANVKDLDKALEYTAALAKGHPIVVESDDEDWLDLRGGDLVVRDVVRIKPDAYTGINGTLLNGKRGRVTAMRNGKITVLLDGDPVELARGHDIDALQKLHVE